MAVEKKSIAKPVAASTKVDAAPAKAEAPKAEAKKPAAKKPAAKKAAAKKPAAKKPAAAKKPVAKKAEVSTKVVLQFFDGNEYTEAALVQKAKEVWKGQGKKAADLTKIELYVKPEERKVYCVLNGESGEFGI